MLVWLAAALAALGLYVSAYFTLVYCGWAAPGSRLVPQVCRLDAHHCTTILHTRYARVLGVPNSAVGLVYYGAVLGLALAGALPVLAPLLLAAGLLTVGLGVYLTYHLLVTLRVPCPLCLASHGINLVLTLVWGALLAPAG